MKFKNIKKKVYVKKSPSNSRTITEGFKLRFPKLDHAKSLELYGGALKFFVVFIFMAAVIVIGYDLQENLQIKQNVDSQRETLTKELSFWEKFIAKHEDYGNAYFQASILEYRLGDTSKAKMYVAKGLSLGQNSVDGKKLEQFLANK